jgi:hypothetical protein
MDVEVREGAREDDGVGAAVVVDGLAGARVVVHGDGPGEGEPRVLDRGRRRDRRGQEAGDRQSAEDAEQTTSHDLVPPKDCRSDQDETPDRDL